LTDYQYFGGTLGGDRGRAWTSVEQRQLTERLADPALYRDAPQQVAAMRARFDDIEQDLSEALPRWQDLEELGSAL
jgi:hypothetical protein